MPEAFMSCNLVRMIILSSEISASTNSRLATSKHLVPFYLLEDILCKFDEPLNSFFRV